MKKKNFVLDCLEASLSPLGYQRSSFWGGSFLKENERHIDILHLLFHNRTDAIEINRHSRSIKEVVDLLAPIYSMDGYKYPPKRKKKYFMDFTIRDCNLIENVAGDYGKTPFSMKYNLWFGLDTEKALSEFCDWLTTYLMENGVPFLDRYSYLPNLLAYMDDLESNHIFWGDPCRGILNSSESMFSGLIISKLCNDNDYNRKFKHWEAIYMGDNYEKERIYFEKLKEILERVEPRYNV